MSIIRQNFVDVLPIAPPGFRCSLYIHGKFSWQLIMVCLLALVIAAQDSASTVVDFVSLQNSTDGSHFSTTITKFNYISTYLPDSSRLSAKSVDGVPYSTNYWKKLKLDSNMADSTTIVISVPNNDTTSLTPNHYKVDLDEELKGNLLRQFDRVDGDLQMFLTLYNINASATANNDDGFEPKLFSALQDQCFQRIVLRDTQVGLKNVLNVTSSPMPTPSCNNCEFHGSYNSSYSCAKLIKLIRYDIGHLRSGVEQAINSKDNVMCINAVYTMNETFRKEVDNLNSTLDQAHQAYKKELDIVSNSMLDLTKNLTNLKETVLKLSKYVESSCVSLIATGEIDKAFEVYKDLESDSKLVNIIRSVYSEYGGNETIVNILDFIDKLELCSRFEIAYEELFRAIDDWNNISDEVLIFFYSEIARRSTCSGSSLMTLKNNIEIEVDRVTIGWSVQFQEGMYDECKQIVDFAKKPKFAYVTKSRLLPIFIPEAYNKVSSNTKNIIKFIGELPNIDQSAVSYSALFNRLRSFPKDLEIHQLMLAYKVKKLMDMDDYRNIDQYYKDICTKIRNSLPSSVKGLIWNGSNCTIRNRELNEYLIVSTLTTIPYTWDLWYANTRISGNIETDSYWAITIEDSGESFTLKNIYRDKYLYALDSHWNDNMFKRSIVTRDTKIEEAFWTVESTDNARYFRLKHVKYEEYLYSDVFDMIDYERHFVFTRKDKNLTDFMYRESQWVISC